MMRRLLDGGAAVSVSNNRGFRQGSPTRPKIILKSLGENLGRVSRGSPLGVVLRRYRRHSLPRSPFAEYRRHIPCFEGQGQISALRHGEPISYTREMT